jgi:phage-related protein
MTRREWNTRPFRTGKRRPVEEWLEGLNPKARVEVLWKIELLEDNGTSLAAPHSRFVEDGLWELRARVGTDEHRIIYFHWFGRTFGLLHGFTKKTQKLDRSDIETARARRAEWLDRPSAD